MLKRNATSHRFRCAAQLAISIAVSAGGGVNGQGSMPPPVATGPFAGLEDGAAESAAPPEESGQVEATEIDPGFAPLPEGWVKITDDVIVRAESLQRAHYDTNTWPAGVIPYEFLPQVTEESQDELRAAMDQWEAVADLLFVPRTVQSNYVLVRNGASEGDNVSALGFQGNAQELRIGNWTRRITLHELGHTLGFQHEHQRPDRDEFIAVNYDNVCQDCCGGLTCNFNFFPLPFSDRFGPYDHLSTMHYRRCVFSVCSPDCSSDVEDCATMRALPDFAEYDSVMGEAVELSFWDGRVASFLYPQNDWRFIRQSGNDLFGAGTFTSPWQSWQHGYDQTPAGGQLWVLESRTFSGPRVLTRPLAIRGGNGSLIFE